MSQAPGALQLRYLATLTEIGAEHNSTIVFPLPLELMEGLIGGTQKHVREAGAPPVAPLVPPQAPTR